MTSHLHKHIMRRVYIIYVCSRIWAVVSERAFWYGGVTAFALALFAKYVHVQSVFNNILTTPPGDVPQFVTATVTDAIAGGELITVLSLCILCAVSLWMVRVVVQLLSLAVVTRHRPTLTQ